MLHIWNFRNNSKIIALKNMITIQTIFIHIGDTRHKDHLFRLFSSVMASKSILDSTNNLEELIPPMAYTIFTKLQSEQYSFMGRNAGLVKEVLWTK